jgi:hypothetical protein
MADHEFLALGVEESLDRFLGDLLGNETDQVVAFPVEKQLSAFSICLGLFQPAQSF